MCLRDRYYGPRYYGPRYYGPRYYGPRYYLSRVNISEPASRTPRAESRGWGYLNFSDPFNIGNTWFIWLGGLALLSLYEYRLFR